MVRTLTQYYPELIPKAAADQYYEYLKTQLPWRDGVYSRRSQKVTRTAYSVTFPLDEPQSYDLLLKDLIEYCTARVELPSSYTTLGAYINYYRHGLEWAPSHSHPRQIQLILSLGATRDLIVGSRTYQLSSGDVIVFGGSTHEVPIRPEVSKGRISLATFIVPVSQFQDPILDTRDLLGIIAALRTGALRIESPD
jgi:hypothetical protein